MTAFTLSGPVRTVSEANQREHRAVVAKRKKLQRRDVTFLWRQYGWPGRVPKGGRYHVELTRVCPPRNKIKDRDNLASAFKAIRDQVAEELGVDDNDLAKDARISFSYYQETARSFGIKVKVTVL